MPTIEHVKQAINWAMGERDLLPDYGYDQEVYLCGTACCVYGAACLLAGETPPIFGGPNHDALGDDPTMLLLVRAMKCHATTPKQMLDIIEGRSRIFGDFNEVVGDASRIAGDVTYIKGDVSNLCGDVTYLNGDVSNLRGDATGVEGRATIRGDVTNIRGRISGLEGDVSGLSGDVTHVYGDATGINAHMTGVEGPLK
jgi:hypothetical protein